MLLLKWCIIICFMLTFFQYTESYQILALMPFPVLSHWLWLQHFLEELLNRGHSLTVLTSYKRKEPHPNYTEILIDPMFDVPAHFPKSELFNMKYNDLVQNLYLYLKVGYLTAEHTLNDKKVQEFLKREDLKFDLILSEQFYQESLLMFSFKYKAPIVTIGTLGYSDFMDRAMGLITPWSIIPHTVLDYSDNMSLKERIYNIYISTMDLYIRYTKYYPQQNELAKRYFSHLEATHGPLPLVEDLEKNISVMLINSHISTSHARPLMPGLISVAGAHMHPPKKLPNDIQEFLDKNKKGVIFFSLGSYVRSKDVPPHKLKIIIDVLRSLDVKVLWKYEDENLKNKPSNVMVKKWIPQADVLAHPNVILFITHGGMFGTQEGLHRGVPMLFIPFYGDQFRNAKRCEKGGYALSVDFVNFNYDDFRNKINEMIINKTYAENMKRASSLFRDNPINPLDESMFWIEYVAKYNGAPHLKSAGINVPWYSYLLLDIILLFLVITLLLIFILYKIIKYILNIFKINKKEKIN